MDVEDANHAAFMRARQDGTLSSFDVQPGYFVGFVNGKFVGHHNNERALQECLEKDYGHSRLPVYIAQA